MDESRQGIVRNNYASRIWKGDWLENIGRTLGIQIRRS